MRFDYFSGDEFLTMLIGSANMLSEKRSEVDALNVFPVPDGDTGTNMYYTFLAGVKEAQKKPKGTPVGEIAAAMAQGSLLGARGNSGVILSQVLYGFSKALEGKDRGSVNDLADAFTMGSDAAWQAVMNPVEGTMLTICKKLDSAFRDAVNRNYDILKAMVHIYRQVLPALEETREMLPVLKEAGVVDAGAKGMVVIIEGILHALKMAAARKVLELFDLAASQQKEYISRMPEVTAIIDYTYCTEMIVKGVDLKLDQLRAELSPYGDCLMVVGSNETGKVHIHSNHPGLVLECCLKYGALYNVQINNMVEQNKSFMQSEKEKPLGLVSVGLGEGIINIMESLGADIVISGGQTMNPSTESILEAISSVNAPKILLLPNNGNVIMAAEQAASMSQKETRLVKTRNIPQGLAALLAYNPFGDIDELAEKMLSAAGMVKCGEVSRAVRDTQYNGTQISEGQFIGIYDDCIVSARDELYPAVLDLVKELVKDNAEILTLYYGADITGSEAQLTAGKLAEEFSSLEIETHYGGQPHYHFIISVE